MHAQYRTLQDLTTERLREAILAGAFSPGQRLHHDALANQFGVSRMPVRQALRVLESEGLVELRPHRGAVVVALRPEDVTKIFEVRALLEARAAVLAAPNIRDDDLARLRGFLEAMEHACSDEQFLALNMQFHMTIYHASGWRHLCALIAAQRNVVQPCLSLATTFLGRSRTAQDEHRSIMRAAEARDGATLAKLTVEHLRTTARWVVDELNRRRTAVGVDPT
jgi:DNA-binding GntR family transcriptional regulator